MAQRLIHLLLADRIIKAGNGEYIKAPERFVFGSLLPDAYREEDQSGTARRDASIFTHFKSATPDMEYRYYDFDIFYRKYAELIRNDDLYSGYYIHLIEDAYYRYYIHTEKGLPRVASPEQVTYMHSDYHLLNAYIVDRYGVKFDVTIPEGFGEERINELYPFDCERQLSELREDYSDRHDSKAKLLTEEMLDGFIEKYAGIFAETAAAVKNGGTLPKPLDLKWSAGVNKDYL